MVEKINNCPTDEHIDVPNTSIAND